MNILIAASEVAPLAKTGGLADVSGALPQALTQLGVNVMVVMPAYRRALQSGREIWPADRAFDIPIGQQIVPGQLLETRLDDGKTPVYLIEQPAYFDRDGLYGDQFGDYRDNCPRFVFFCRAVLEAIQLLEFEVDVIHCHDWQTGLIPAYLRTDYGMAHNYERIASLMTVHNMAYQGRFWPQEMMLTGLDWKYFNWRELEFHGDLNLLKAGMVYADAINTVSPQYAREIQYSPLGCGLEGVLRDRADVLSGIVDGIDPQVWNPTLDPHLASNYSVENWREGKAQCKAALQRELSLPVNPDAPLIGMIGRLADQKGWDLIADLIPRWAADSPVQWAILGSGEARYEHMLASLSQRYYDRVAVKLEFSDALAHRIEAGADMFLMPSRYEPCGLNQLYSLAYGTPPIVRATGGLADTVINADEATIADGTATGFSFTDYHYDALNHAVQRAISLWEDQRSLWAGIVQTGMKQDWSWTASAHKYVELYERVARTRRG